MPILFINPSIFFKLDRDLKYSLMSFGFVQSKCLANILLRYFLFKFILSIFDLYISDKYTFPPELIILFAIAKPKPSAPAEII